MKRSLRWKFGEWLASTWLRPWVLEHNGPAPDSDKTARCLYRNRVNNHVVVAFS